MLITIIKNIGTILTGDIDNPKSEATTIVLENNLIKEIGEEELLLKYDADKIIDANESTVFPGLFDSHCHVTVGDYGHRQKTHDFIDSALHGGVTSVISAGEVHYPGRPKDPSGTKALALVSFKSFNNLRPSGVKVHAGSLILEKGLKEEDFKELAEEGLHIVGEVGLGSVNSPETAKEMVEWAHKYNFTVQMHTGGTSIPGSSTVTAEMVMETNPDVVSHINGGPTSVSQRDVDMIMDESDLFMEIVHCGNFKMADHVLRRAKEKEQLDRIIFGNDSPSGSGIMPLGILRNITHAACMSTISPAEAVCMATGNTARAYGFNTGMIKEGCEADLVFADAPLGSVATTAEEAFSLGDLPGISFILIDGEVVVKKSRNTPPAVRQARLLDKPAKVIEE